MPTPSAEIGISEFLALRASGQPFELVDCREPWEWELVHLDGCRLVPLGELPDRVAECPTDRPVVVYCHHGVRSLRAAFVLRAAGVPARSLAGGIDRYSEEVDPSLPRY